ncbi:MAG: SpoIVB peptidase [Desulfotomaculaceae bacterium]|nr:SpoIVB peptidase [Desulfotomaculaceae bacterium]
MRGKIRDFLCGILVLLISGMIVLLGYFPVRHTLAVGEPLLLDFPAPIENLIPVRNVSISILPQIKVVPCGQSIGVLLHTQGVMVVGHYTIVDQIGNKVNPALDAGVSVGDIILKIEGETVKNEGQVKDIITRAGASRQALNFEVKHGNEVFYTKVNPVYCRETLQYLIGVLIKDSAAGMGTLTFYEPQSMTYGALGHIITENGTQRPVEIIEGKIVGANVQSIHRGKRGQPGEKIGSFQEDEGQISGSIVQNTKLGIFGKLQKPPLDAESNAPIPVATVNQIQNGPAEILTVLKDNQVERFDIEILKLNLKSQDGKGMVIKITDQRLLEQTGGIIQGMSGSPIIQDNKLVGAITHVFVNDPTRGYGVPAQWMLWEGGLAHEEKRIAS